MQSVRIMLSYDYNHFEVSLGVPDDAPLEEVNEVRKSCQRLCDEAVRQFKVAKEMAAKRTDGQYAIEDFKAAVRKIIEKPEEDRTIKEIAMLKQYEYDEWQNQFRYDYDYDDDDDDAAPCW
jgi:hypothetical protein